MKRKWEVLGSTVCFTAPGDCDWEKLPCLSLKAEERYAFAIRNNIIIHPSISEWHLATFLHFNKYCMQCFLQLQVWREKTKRKGIQQCHAPKEPDSNHQHTRAKDLHLKYSLIYFNAMIDATLKINLTNLVYSKRGKAFTEITAIIWKR